MRLLESRFNEILFTTNVWCDRNWRPGDIFWLKPEQVRSLNELEILAVGAL
jgi:hypothetical protein